MGIRESSRWLSRTELAVCAAQRWAMPEPQTTRHYRFIYSSDLPDLFAVEVLRVLAGPCACARESATECC